MKKVNEILEILAKELVSRLDEVSSTKESLTYYNELMGNASILLAGLLESLLKQHFNEWVDGKWIDDCLITKVHLQDLKWKIGGVVIWGKMNTTDQWTDPFVFFSELDQEKRNFDNYTFFFGDANSPELPYEDFNDDRDYWAATERDWRFVIHSND